MKKSSLTVPSILSVASSLMLSAEASMVNENLADFVPQIQHSSTISNEQVFDRKACYRAIARKHDELTSYDISDEEKLIVMFDLGKLYYGLAKNSKDLDEKRAYYEQSELYFKESKLLEAGAYLVDIIQFKYDQS